MKKLILLLCLIPFLGIEDLLTPIILLFPNPTEGKISVQSLKQFVNYTVFSVDGNEVISADFKGNEVDISPLKPGIYFIQFKGVNTFSLQRIVKN